MKEPIMKRPIEPFFWSLFGGGGAQSALFLPVLLVLTGLAIPLGWIHPSYIHLKALVDPWYSRLLILAIISLSMFHWAHRFRFTLHEGLQLHPYDKLIAMGCYGGAAAVTVVSIFVLFVR
jgi:fumarate reductase subunit D